MNRLLTLTSGGLFATMAILPIAAFAQTGAAATQDSKTPAPVTAQAETPKAGATETKAPVHETKSTTMAKHEDKHGASVETQKPVTHSSAQPKVTDPSKS
jgi:hypothetical protein